MSKSIFLLETDDQLCSLIVPILEGRGHTVKRESSGHCALELVKTDKPDLVIVGEQLSDIDGIGWIIKIRQTDRTTKIAFLSQIWRDAEFYQQVVRELKVSQIFHRPIKSALFGPQIDALWADKRLGPPPGQANMALSVGGQMPVPGAMSSGQMGGGLGQMPVPVSVGASLGDPSTALPVPGISAEPAVPAFSSVPLSASIQMPTPGQSSASISSLADATLLAFRQKFSKSLPSRIKQIGEIVDRVQRANPDPKELAEARRLAHNLKGTSRSCGFDKLGGFAELLENSLRDMLEHGADEWNKVDKGLHDAKKESERVRVQFMDYVPTAEELENLNSDSAKARVLMVCVDDQPKMSMPNNGTAGIPLELVRVPPGGDVIMKAGEKQIDAAMIEILPGQRDQAFQLARELRSMPGYDNLPLGFIYEQDHDGDRSDATHAGASIFIEKPYGRDTLNEALQHLITIREGGRSRVLIVDDDEDFTELICVALGNEGMLVRALHDPFKVMDALEEYAPDLMLLDVMMPGILGFDVCRKVRAGGRWQDLPIIFLTAQTDLNSRLSAFDAGGDDYLIKPVINAELLKRVKVRLDKARMQRERQDRDVLTGLLLRRAFSDSLGALLAESERHGFNFSLSLLDIDHFKKVNDTYGHMAGDRVLSHVGKLLRKRFRVEDLRGRWGGEEFILGFRHEKKGTMQKALNRVLEELRKVEFKGDKGESFYVTFSAGMVDFPADGINAHDLILRADSRLYIAKKNGRNQIVIDG